MKRVKAKLRERMHEDVHDTAQWPGESGQRMVELLSSVSVLGTRPSRC